MDAFEEMLEAVRQANTTRTDYTNNWREDDEPLPNVQTKSYHPNQHVPFDRIDLAIATFAPAHNASFTRNDYVKVKANLQSFPRCPHKPLRHKDKLYPELAVQAAWASESCWIGGDPDSVLEHLMYEWLQTSGVGAKYFQDLFGAITEAKVYGLTLALLNRSILVSTSDDEIVINTARPNGHPRHAAPKEIVLKRTTPIFNDQTRTMLREFLRKQNAHTTSGKRLAEAIGLYNNFSWENRFLARLGYVLLRLLSRRGGVAPSPKLLGRTESQSNPHTPETPNIPRLPR